MSRLILRLRLWLLESEISEAEQLQHHLRRELPAMHDRRRDLLQELWALDSDHPA